MTLEMWVTLAILIGAIILFVTEWLRVDVVALGVVVLLMVTGILTTPQALAGFSNPVVLIVTALFIVGGGLQQTGLVTIASERILTIAGNSADRRADAGGGALCLHEQYGGGRCAPAFVGLARGQRQPQLLIPVVCVVAGRLTTLIDTTPNIISPKLLSTAKTFTSSATPIGLLILAAGIISWLRWAAASCPTTPVGATRSRSTARASCSCHRLPDNLFRLRIVKV